MLRFLVFGVSGTCAGLSRVCVSLYVGGVIVVYLCIFIRIDFFCHLLVYLWLRRCVAKVRIGRCRVGEGMG